jgi:hypothetical protein
MRYRYAKPEASGLKLLKQLKTLEFIQLVPVVGLEPTRRFLAFDLQKTLKIQHK